MKQCVAILLSLWIGLISFFPKTDASYLLDFETLANHFQEHQKRDNIDFWQFLWLHYARTEHQTQDQNHKQLPLQHHHTECVSLTIIATPTFEIKNDPQVAIEIQNYLDWQSFYHFQLTKEDFQPPRC
jgi:hypothetical protein